MTRNVRLTKPTPGSASHLVPITPLTTHVSCLLGGWGEPGRKCLAGEEARILPTVGEQWLYWTHAALSAVLAQSGPQAQSRAEEGVENQGQGM